MKGTAIRKNGLARAGRRSMKIRAATGLTGRTGRATRSKETACRASTRTKKAIFNLNLNLDLNLNFDLNLNYFCYLLFGDWIFNLNVDVDPNYW